MGGGGTQKHWTIPLAGVGSPHILPPCTKLFTKRSTVTLAKNITVKLQGIMSATTQI